MFQYIGIDKFPTKTSKKCPRARQRTSWNSSFSSSVGCFENYNFPGFLGNWFYQSSTVDTGTSLWILNCRRLVFLKRVFCLYEKVEAELKSNKELSDNKLEELQKEYKAR